MREFKDSITGDSKDDDDQKPGITRASAMPEAPAAGGSEHAATPGPGSGEAGPDRRP
jgi:hypothetical protein